MFFSHVDLDGPKDLSGLSRSLTFLRGEIIYLVRFTTPTSTPGSNKGTNHCPSIITTSHIMPPSNPQSNSAPTQNQPARLKMTRHDEIMLIKEIKALILGTSYLFHLLHLLITPHRPSPSHLRPQPPNLHLRRNHQPLRLRWPHPRN